MNRVNRKSIIRASLKDGYTNVEEFINDTDPTKFIDYRKPENNVSSLHRADTIHSKKQ